MAASAAAALTGQTAVAAPREAAVVQAASASASVWDGVYTGGQAGRGAEAYASTCAACHQSDLSGDVGRDAPPLAGEEFVSGWEGQSLLSLLQKIVKTMPGDSPGSLGAQASLDIVAYLLASNEFPDGPAELEQQPGRLAQIRIELTPAAQGQ